MFVTKTDRSRAIWFMVMRAGTYMGVYDDRGRDLYKLDDRAYLLRVLPPRKPGQMSRLIGICCGDFFSFRINRIKEGRLFHPRLVWGT